MTDTLTPERLAELRKTAEAALAATGRQRWEIAWHNGKAYLQCASHTIASFTIASGRECGHAAAFDPTTALALLDAAGATPEADAISAHLAEIDRLLEQAHGPDYKGCPDPLDWRRAAIRDLAALHDAAQMDSVMAHEAAADLETDLMSVEVALDALRGWLRPRLPDWDACEACSATETTLCPGHMALYALNIICGDPESDFLPPEPKALVEAAAPGAFRQRPRPTIVCLCGSTRFWREFQRASLAETLAGKIVLSIGAASGTDDEHFGNLPRDEYDRVKAELDALHLRKIDLADEVLVLNVGGYIGESTRREIEYAKRTGTPIRYLEPILGAAPDALESSSLTDTGIKPAA